MLGRVPRVWYFAKMLDQESSQIRAVIGARVSSYDDEGQVSPYVQYGAGERYVQRQGWQVVGHFQDLDVSASIAPWDRPDLGPWLSTRAHEWDAMVFAKVDRLIRSSKDCADIAHWAEQNKKILAFTDDGICLNFREDADSFSTMMSKIFLMLASLFAEMELKRIRSRIKDAQAYLRTKDRWKGGLPPFGYEIIPHPEGGKTLRIDPFTADIVRTAAGMVIEGKSLWEVADTFNAKGIPTPTTYGKGKAGSRSRETRETKGTWVSEQVGRILRNQACLGLKMMGRGTNRRLVRGENGLPVRIADPLFTDEEWAALQAALNQRSVSRERSHNAAPLLGIVYCKSCGERLYKHSSKPNGPESKEYVYYRCIRTATKPKCNGYTFKADQLQSFLDDQITQDLADIPVTRRVFVPGEDHTKELEQVKKALSDIRSEFDLGLYDYKGGDEEYKERVTNLVAQRKILEELPQREDGWYEEETGETYAEAYKRAGTDERRAMLLSADVRLYCAPYEMHLSVPRDLSERARSYGHGLLKTEGE